MANGKTIEELKADLLSLGQRGIAIQGAMQYVQQSIIALEKKEAEEAKKEDKEGGKH